MHTSMDFLDRLVVVKTAADRPLSTKTLSKSTARPASTHSAGPHRGRWFAAPFIIFAIIFAQTGTVQAGKPISNGKNSGSNETTSSTFTPLAIEAENYYFRYSTRNCLGEDDEFTWKALGDLKPGESFTFTPQYPGCKYHSAVISAVASWQGSELTLSSEVPDYDKASNDPTQKFQQVIAPNHNNSAQLCMFPFYRTTGTFYSITITNTGPDVAKNIVLDGSSNNDWAINFYNRCMNADADNDGWNDSLEHSMSMLLYTVGSIDGVLQPDILWGSNYLKEISDTAGENDEIDSYPPDFNDDGLIDSRDIDALTPYLGQGNGIPLEQISPNPSDAEYAWANAHAWRRYDLDADGYVDQTDVDIVATLIGHQVPTQEDIIAPTARIVTLEGTTIPKGTIYKLEGHVWDNASIAQVEYLVDGRVECTATTAVPAYGNSSPFHACWWQVPKRGGIYTLGIRAYDTTGNMTTSDSVEVLVD